MADDEYNLFTDNTKSNVSSMTKEMRDSINNTDKAVDMITGVLSKDDDVVGMDIAGKSNMLSIVQDTGFVKDLKNKKEFKDDDTLFGDVTKKKGKGSIARAIDYLNAEVVQMANETINSLIQNSHKDINRINKYIETDNLEKQVTDVGVIVDTYTNAIVNGDGDRTFPLALDDDIDTDDDKIVKVTKITDKIIIDHSLNSKINKVIEDAVKYGDGFLLVSQISDFMIKSLSTNYKNLTNDDLLDDLTTDGKGGGGAPDGYKRGKNKGGRVINEDMVTPKGTFLLNDKVNIDISNGELEDLKNYLIFLNTKKYPTPSEPDGEPMSTISLPKNNATFLQEALNYYGNKHVIECGGNIDEYVRDSGISIISEVSNLKDYDFENIFTEKKEFNPKNYLNDKYRAMNESSGSSYTDTDIKKQILKNMAKRSKRLKGSVIKRLSPYTVIKLMTGDNFCIGYIYIKQEATMDSSGHSQDYKYTQNQKGTFGALGTIPTHSLNISGSPSEGTPISDFGVGANNNNNNYLMQNQNDQSALGKITKTISKILLSTVENLPEGIDKLDDQTFINIYKMIDIKKTNKIYFFKPEDISHIMIDENDDGYGDGLLGTSLVNIGKISLLLDRIRINSQIEKIPQKIIKFFMPDGGNPTEMVTAARKLVSKSPLITAASTGNVTQIDSSINSFGTKVTPIVGEGTPLIEVTADAIPVSEVDPDFIESITNRLRRLSGLPLSAFDLTNDSEAPKVVTLLANEATFAKRIDAIQKSINTALSDALKRAIINDLLTYNQLIDIDKFLKKSITKDVNSTIKKNKEDTEDSLQSALSPLKNDMAKISSAKSDTAAEAADVNVNPYDDEKYVQSQMHDDKKAKENIEDKLKKDDEDSISETNDLSDEEFVELVHKVTTLNYTLQSPSMFKFQTFSKIFETISEGADAMARAEYPETMDNYIWRYNVTGDSDAEDGDKIDEYKVKRDIYKSQLIKENISSDNLKNKTNITDTVDQKFEELIRNIKASATLKNNGNPGEDDDENTGDTDFGDLDTDDGDNTADSGPGDEGTGDSGGGDMGNPPSF